ncbi:hypothetical protein AB0F42_24395 [Streptomyces buecherae]|uniref:hypothetical protein n=1 Tax=Streptomyces buecherae TaxID=2763006 RepID=UPI003405C567
MKRLSWAPARAADRLTTGSTRLAAHLATRASTWCRRSRRTDLEGWRAALGPAIRTAVLAGAGYAALRLLRARPVLMWVAAGAWAVAAWRVGHPDWQPQEMGEQADEEGEEVADPDAPIPLTDLADALSRVGTPHAHLAALAAHLDATPARVRASLRAHGVPVETVRMRGAGASTGIKATAMGAVVAAGQASNNNTNNTPAATSESGLRVDPIGQCGAVLHQGAGTRHTVERR